MQINLFIPFELWSFFIFEMDFSCLDYYPFNHCVYQKRFFQTFFNIFHLHI